MGKGPRSRSSPRVHQTLWGLTLLTLLLMIVEQTNSEEVYESWNYGRNQLIRDMKETMDSIVTSLKEIKKEIHYIRNFSNIPLTHEERLANFSCPTYFTVINTTLECIHIGNRYSTYNEATESCAALGAHLFVPKDIRLLGDFLMEVNSQRRADLPHDIFWIGADKNADPDMLRWVDGKPVDVHTLVYSTEPGGLADLSPRTNLCGVLRLDKHGQDESEDNKLTVKPCEEPQKYPYLCEIDSGSESIVPESPSFRDICPEHYHQFFATGECIYYSPINESLNYYEAGKFCRAQGASLIHPKNLTLFMKMLNDSFTLTLNINPSDNYFETEYGGWLSNTVTSLDQDWNDMMQQFEPEEHGTDMCTLLKTKPPKIGIYKEIASCSSRQNFFCSLNMHSKTFDIFLRGSFNIL